jgi:integrase
VRLPNRLSALTVSKISKPGRYADGGGLYLRVAAFETKAGTGTSKNWVFRFARDGRERFMGLGTVNTLSLAEARQRARLCRQTILDGGDPIEVRKERRMAARIEAAKTVTFREAAETFMRTHLKALKSEVHQNQWRTTLATYAYPVLGDLAVSAVDTTLMLKVLEPIWESIPDTAARLRGRIERVLDAAAARGQRNGDNPARWAGHLDKLLPARKRKAERVRHHPAMAYADVPAFMGELRSREDISSRALEFLILTAARTNETIGARWSEFDLAAKLWTVPGERMKSGRPHIVPLSDRACTILAALPRVAGTEPFVFPGARDGKPLSNMACLELLRGMRPGLTVHGFRSSFRDWCGDRTNFARDVIEAALAHVVVDETEAAYRRSTAVEKRRRLMGDWAKFCSAPARNVGGNVTSIQGKTEG